MVEGRPYQAVRPAKGALRISDLVKRGKGDPAPAVVSLPSPPPLQQLQMGKEEWCGVVWWGLGFKRIHHPRASISRGQKEEVYASYSF